MQYVRPALLNKLVAAQSIELQAPLLSLIEVVVVSGVAEHTRSDDILDIIAIWMGFGKKMIPRKSNPILKRCFAIQTAILANEIVTLVDNKGVTSKSVGKGAAASNSAFSWEA